MNWETPRSLEQSLVSPGLGRTPHAHRNAAEVSGASDLAQDVFAGILGQVQVHQDQVWNCRIRIGPLPADESEGFASAQQVNQFKSEILLLQRPLEKEDVRAVVFNDQDAGRGNNRSVFQAHSQRPTSPHFHQLTACAICGDTCLALTIQPLGRGSDIEKGITGHQRQHVLARRSEYPYIIRLHDLERFDFVFEIAAQRRESDLVLDPQILQRAKERVPVSGEAHVAGLPRQRRAGNMSDRAPESGSVDPFDDHRGKQETGNLNAADQTVRRGGGRAFAGAEDSG